ncbi:MAG: hypothetical protein SNJ64_05685 [Endomicrobiia bacterium]
MFDNKKLTKDYLQVQPFCVWSATLNNGEVIYFDDFYYEGESSWLRLKKYCEEYDLFIQNISLHFRKKKNLNVLEPGTLYVCFMKKIVQILPDDTIEFFVFYLIFEDRVLKKTYTIPTLEIVEKKEVPLSSVPEFMIRCKER